MPASLQRNGDANEVKKLGKSAIHDNLISRVPVGVLMSSSTFPRSLI
jgi:hypothetical protein